MGNSVTTTTSKPHRNNAETRSQLGSDKSEGSKKPSPKQVTEPTSDTLETLESERAQSNQKRLIRQKTVIFESPRDLLYKEQVVTRTTVINTDPKETGVVFTVSTFTQEKAHQLSEGTCVQPMEKRKQLLKLGAFCFEDDQENGVSIKTLVSLHNYRPQEICCNMRGATSAIQNVVPYLEKSIDHSSLLIRRQTKSSAPL